MAEGVFQNLVEQRGLKDQWEIDSSGTAGYHIGNPPDDRTMKVLQKNGVNNYKHKARQLKPGDFKKFEYIFGMDHENIEDINNVAPKDSTAQVLLLGSFDPKKELIIPDPYYTVHQNKNAFPETYDQCLRCCIGFLDSVSS